MMKAELLRTGLAALFVLVLVSATMADAVARLRPDQLKRTHEAVKQLQEDRQPVELSSGYRDFRACLHVHSGLSHDSTASLAEVIAGAKEANVQILMFNEHPSDSFDYVSDGHQGIRDGVLLIPGAETNGFLAFPKESVQNLGINSQQEFIELVRRTGGMVFLSHLEARWVSWKFSQLTGTEIYNSHADVIGELGLIGTLPQRALEMASSLEAYPQEVYSSIQDYSSFYLRLFDTMCQIRPHTGVAANDAHHNLIFAARMGEQGRIRIEDASGEKFAEIDGSRFQDWKQRLAGKRVGDIVVQLDIDPYAISLRHVSTHLLMNELSVEATWNALESGRAYVAFDWLADPTDFVFLAEDGTKRASMGSEITWSRSLQVRAEAPLAAKIRIVRNGTVVHEELGKALRHSVTEPGVYRVEYWLDVAGEAKPWSLSNPIYVRRE